MSVFINVFVKSFCAHPYNNEIIYNIFNNTNYFLEREAALLTFTICS